MNEVSSILTREDQDYKFKLLNENLLIRNKSQDDLPYGQENTFIPSNRYGKSTNISILKKDGQPNQEKLSKWLFKQEYQNKIVDMIEKGPQLPE